MQADFYVELAEGDPTLELPWRSADPAIRYFDLKIDPAQLATLPEARANAPLREFLSAINLRTALLTAKCDTWISDQMDAEDDVFGAPWKFCSYVDLAIAGGDERFSFRRHERFARDLLQLLAKVPEIPAAAELVIRRCYFHEQEASGRAVRPGFYFTLYCSGYGDDEAHARKSWEIVLKLLENALLQLAPELSMPS
jgi:hypothetical protein